MAAPSAPPAIELPPGIAEARTMSEDEYLALEHDGYCEWIDGVAYFAVAAGDEHQRIVAFLDRVLGSFVDQREAGIVRTAPYAMRGIPGRSWREPDVLFVSNERLHLVQPNGLHGPADFIIEVVSDGSGDRDYGDKFDEYLEAGVREYWIVEARTGKEAIRCWVRGPDLLFPGREMWHPRAIEPDGTVRSATVPGFWMRGQWLWQENAKPFDSLTQILAGEPAQP